MGSRFWTSSGVEKVSTVGLVPPSGDKSVLGSNVSALDEAAELEPRGTRGGARPPVTLSVRWLLTVEASMYDAIELIGVDRLCSPEAPLEVSASAVLLAASARESASLMWLASSTIT